MNMLDRGRLASKKESKTEAVQSTLADRLGDEDIHIGPSDYIPWLNDNKLCFLRIEGGLFGDVPMNLEMRLSVEDSPNSAAVVVDAIRCCKVALERGLGGVLVGPSAAFCKHPPQQFSDDVAAQLTEEFIAGDALAGGMNCLIIAAGHRQPAARRSPPVQAADPGRGQAADRACRRAAAAGGATAFTVVTGHEAERVEAFLAELAARTGHRIVKLRLADWERAQRPFGAGRRRGDRRRASADDVRPSVRSGDRPKAADRRAGGG